MKNNTDRGGETTAQVFTVAWSWLQEPRERTKGKLAFSGAFAHTLDNQMKYNESYIKHILQNTKIVQ